MERTGRQRRYMALKFEDAWMIKGTTYIREFDTTKGKSAVRVSPHKSEYYLEDPLGEYSSFLEPDVKLRRVQGSAFNVDNAYGVKSGVYTTIREEYFYTDKEYNKDINVWYMDIETSVGTVSTGFPDSAIAPEPIVLMQFFDKKTNKGYVLGLEEWYYRKDYSYDFDLEYIKYDSEKEMVEGYLKLFKELDPYIIYAWNGDGFDYPYIYNRMKKLGIDTNKLSNYGSAKLKTKKLDNGTIQNDLEATGHWYSDMINSYKKFVSVFEPVASMSLDFVGQRETGIAKVEHNNYIKFDDFRIGKYKILGNETKEQKAKIIHKCAVALESGLVDDTQKAKYRKYIKEKSYSEFVHYGVQDFVILKGIDDARNLTGIMVQMADMTGSRLNDAHGTLKYWDAYISATILKDKLVTPPKKENDASDIVGGYVAPPVVGKHKWILSGY
jgi:DNA polymerase elongation subunit (family B)